MVVPRKIKEDPTSFGDTEEGIKEEDLVGAIGAEDEETSSHRLKTDCGGRAPRCLRPMALWLARDEGLEQSENVRHGNCFLIRKYHTIQGELMYIFVLQEERGIFPVHHPGRSKMANDSSRRLTGVVFASLN